MVLTKLGLTNNYFPLLIYNIIVLFLNVLKASIQKYTEINKE